MNELPQIPVLTWDELLKPDLCQNELALQYLNELLEENDSRVFLSGLRQVAKARGINFAQIAQELSLSPRGLYKALSNKGNPQWMTMTNVLRKLGFSVQLGISQPHQVS